jgi:pimeloyl-ACP methyl ester carboxylesterase
MKGYFCGGDINTAHLPYWRLGSTSSQAIIEKAMDAQGNIQIDLVNGLENYKHKVLFLTGECNTVIGPDYQKGHLKYFPKAEMIVVKNAGHSMIGEKPEECIGYIRHYIRETDDL